MHYTDKQSELRISWLEDSEDKSDLIIINYHKFILPCCIILKPIIYETLVMAAIVLKDIINVYH